MDWMPQAIRDGIIVILIISGPIVLLAAAIGLAVGILQAATQVQEQTIGSALKIIGVFALLIGLGYWIFGYLNQYTTRQLNTAFTFIPQQTQKVMPPDEYSFHAPKKSNSALRSKDTEPEIPILMAESIDENIETLSPQRIGTMFTGSQDIMKQPNIEYKEPPAPPTPPKPPTQVENQEENAEGYQDLKPIPGSE